MLVTLFFRGVCTYRLYVSILYHIFIYLNCLKSLIQGTGLIGEGAGAVLAEREVQEVQVLGLSPLAGTLPSSRVLQTLQALLRVLEVPSFFPYV